MLVLGNSCERKYISLATPPKEKKKKKENFALILCTNTFGFSSFAQNLRVEMVNKGQNVDLQLFRQAKEKEGDYIN